MSSRLLATLPNSTEVVLAMPSLSRADLQCEQSTIVSTGSPEKGTRTPQPFGVERNRVIGAAGQQNYGPRRRVCLSGAGQLEPEPGLGGPGQITLLSREEPFPSFTVALPASGQALPSHAFRLSAEAATGPNRHSCHYPE